MAGKTKNRRTGGSGSVFQDSKGRWHFRKDMGTDPATGRRRPPIEATGMVKSEARARRARSGGRRVRQSGRA